ncbi:hypothetical protein ACROYT_G029893 [Oculina patagonica]
MTQGPRVPVAVPIQAGGGMVPVQTIEPGAQGGPLQLVTTPVSGADGYQPQMVQAVAAEAMTTGNQPLQVDMPPPYEEVEYNMPPPYVEVEYNMPPPYEELEYMTLVYLWVSQSITSAVLGGTIIIFYSLTIVHENSAMVFAWIVFILGIVEFAIGIWAAVCVCLMKPCRNIAPPQQGPGGAPVAIPVQPVQTVIPVAQGGQPQISVVPVSGVEGYHSQMVQVAASHAMTTGYQPLQVDMPPPYEEVEHMT